MISRKSALIGFVLIVLLACGGGGGAGTSPQSGGGTPPPPPPPSQGPAPLSPDGLANLEAFTRVYGFVRHFHPSDEAATADWDALAADGVRKAEGQSTPQDLAAFLQSYFSAVAPTVQIFLQGNAPPLPAELQTQPSSIITWWDSHGWGVDMARLGQMQDPNYFNVRRQGVLASQPAGITPPDQPFEADLPRGLHCRVPLSLVLSSGQTIPASTQAKPYPPNAVLNYEDRATRLAAIVQAWNVWEHFFPYFQESGTDWNQALAVGLNGAANAADTKAFGALLVGLQARLVDCHGAFTLQPYFSFNRCPPFCLDWVEGKWVVATLLSGAPPSIHLGDALTEADGTPISQIYSDFASLSCGTDQYTRAFARSGLLALSGTNGDHSLTFQQPGGGTYTLPVTYDSQPMLFGGAPVEPRPAATAQVAPGVLYLDLGRLHEAELQAQLPAARAAQGLILDMRGYPQDEGVRQILIPALLATPTAGRLLEVPLVRKPDAPLAYVSQDLNPINPSGPRITAKTIVIADGRTISSAEDLLFWFRAAGIPILGQPTAGADGDVTQMALAGGFTFIFTGMRIRYPDGGLYFGRGIQPDLPVARTIVGVAAGKDELLEAAIQQVKP